MAWTSDAPECEGMSPTAPSAGRTRLWHADRVEAWWWAFVAVNSYGILLFRDWATVPFHFIWIGLSLLYGWRAWSTRATAISLALIAGVTGGTLLADVLSGHQTADELTEVPLMSAVFIAMVFHVRRRVAAQRETERVSEHNLALLERERRLVQDASHVLRTPLTIALGHAELLQRTTEGLAAEDAQVVVDELHRLKRTTDRLLSLARSEQPGFLSRVPLSVQQLVPATANRWRATHPAVGIGSVDDARVTADPDHVTEALDEMIGNAVAHTPDGTPIEVSAARRGAFVVVAVGDRGPGIPPDLAPDLFDRFARGPSPCGRGAGLGLAIVKAISEAHGGRVEVRERAGGGAVFEMWLPLATGEPAAEARPRVEPRAVLTTADD